MAKDRKDFDDSFKWNVKDLYDSDESCKKELKKIGNNIKKISKYKGIILSNADNLLELLELDSDITMHLEKAYMYAHINADADTLDNNYKELLGLVQNVYVSYLEASSFIVPELLKSDYLVVQNYIKKNKKLKKYNIVLKDIYRNKKHVLNEESEGLLSNYSKLMNSPDEIMSALSDSDFKFEPIIVDGKETELTESNYNVYLKHKDRKVREMAFKSMYKTYGNFKNTIAAILKSEIEKNVVNSKVRKYKSSLEGALFPNKIDLKVYNNLINSVHNHLDSLYKYWNLKKKLLNLDEMHIYDTYTEGEKEESNYSFSLAKDLIFKALNPLGNDYLKDLDKAFNEHWIDWCNNKGKRTGAYCTACYLSHPYVLMNYENTLNDVSTLIHELGHAMQYYYSCKYQSYEDYNYSIFVAEVASQVNEIILSRYLLDNTTSNKEKISIIDELLQKFKSTIFRQTMFAEFELFLHEYVEKGGILTSENMCQKYYELNKLYYGKNVLIDDEIKYEWERIPHFYMHFYVYQYATGFAAAVKIANLIYEGNKNIRDNYLKFLSLGNTKSPIDSLKVAGVDIKDASVIDDAIKFMDELINEYELLQGSVKNG